MGEFRQDLTTKDWVLIAEKRSGKPNDFKHKPATPENLPKVSDECPFCEGKSNATPVIIKQYPDKGRWLVRVVPNKFQALEHVEDISNKDFYHRRSASGEHEVIFTYPHNKPLAKQEVETIDWTLKSYLDRIEALCEHDEVDYVHIIQNHGAPAGASLIHPHSQIFTTPFIPERIQSELNGTGYYYEEHNSCLYCDIIKYELGQKVRVVYDDVDFIVMAPFASKVPYQMRVLPKRHMADFRDLTEKERKSLAKVMKEIFSRLYDRLDNPAYNYYLHTVPNFSPKQNQMWDYEESYHWHMVIMPRFSKFAGFELGTEVYVNIVPPEEAAETLR